MTYSVSYDPDEARAYGIAVAVLIGNVRYFTAVHQADGEQEYYHSMKAIAEAVGLSYRTIKRAAAKAVELGLITCRAGYKPGTTTKTTFWGLAQDGKVEKVLSEGDNLTPSEGDNLTPSLINKKKDINIKENRDLPKRQIVGSSREQKVLNYWCQRFAKDQKRYKLTKKRIAKIEARLKDAGAEMLKKAIDNASQDYFYRGDNDRGWIADIDYITRSYEIVEKLANLQPARQAPQKHMSWQERQEQREFDEWKAKTDQQVERETNDDRYTLWTDPETGKEEWILQSELRKIEGK